MPTNPLVDQGTLNRLRASVNWDSFPSLNIIASYLAPAAITLALQGNATDIAPTLTGTVPSPAPYQAVELRMALLRTQQLANLYKLQQEKNTFLGNCTVRPDTNPLSPYQFFNCAIMSTGEQNFGGQDPAYVVTISGYYILNSDLWAAS